MTRLPTGIKRSFEMATRRQKTLPDFTGIPSQPLLGYLEIRGASGATEPNARFGKLLKFPAWRSVACLPYVFPRPRHSSLGPVRGRARTLHRGRLGVHEAASPRPAANGRFRVRGFAPPPHQFGKHTQQFPYDSAFRLDS